MNASTLAVYTNGSSRSSNKIGNEVLQGASATADTRVVAVVVVVV